MKGPLRSPFEGRPGRFLVFGATLLALYDANALLMWRAGEGPFFLLSVLLGTPFIVGAIGWGYRKIRSRMPGGRGDA